MTQGDVHLTATFGNIKISVGLGDELDLRVIGPRGSCPGSQLTHLTSARKPPAPST